MTEFISLGTQCYSAIMLRRLSLGRYGLPVSGPLPFDWIFSDVEMILHCLEDNFEALLDRDLYQAAPSFHGESQVSHQLYRPYPRALFAHFDPLTKFGYTYLRHSVERMLNILDSDDRKIFLIAMSIHAHERSEVVGKFSRLCEAIHSRTRNAAVLGFSLIKVTVIERTGINVDFSNKLDVLYNVRHRSTVSEFANPEFASNIEAVAIDKLILERVKELDAIANDDSLGIPSLKDGSDLWPRPSFAPAREKELRERASRADETFDCQIAQVKLLAADGDREAARAILSELKEKYPPKSIHHGVLRLVVTAAMQCGDIDSAGYYLGHHFDVNEPMAFEVVTKGSKSDQEASVVNVVIQDDRVSFRFQPSILQSHTGDSLLERFVDAFPLLNAFLTSPYRRCGEVALNMGDAGACPGLAFCEYRPGYYLIPDPFFLGTGGYQEFKDDLDAKWVPWDDRERRAMWRGSTTGLETNGWRSLPRIRLCEIAKTRPDILDAGITGGISLSDATAGQQLRDMGLLNSYVPAKDFQKYRYQIDIDGNTNSWSGLLTKLLTGSPVLKVQSPMGWRQWYYDRLKPWVNYIPVAEDMSDLIEKVEWLLNNDDAAREIGEAGRQLGLSLTRESELLAAAKIISLAVIENTGKPGIDLNSDCGSFDTESLRMGWKEPNGSGVESTGTASSLVVPKPVCLGDAILTVQLSSLSDRPQRVVVAVNGDILLQKKLTGQATLYCPLPATLVREADMLEILFLHPVGEAATAAAGATNPSGIVLHRLSVAPANIYSGDEDADLSAALSSLSSSPNASSAHDLYGSAAALALDVELKLLHTFHGSIVYADPRSGRLRHGPSDEVAHNVYMTQEQGAVRLLYISPNGRRFLVGLKPEGAGRNSENAEHDKCAREFELVTPGASKAMVFHLKSAGVFMCAEPSGEVTLSRPQAGGWEEFSVGLLPVSWTAA
jgi:hypothetical protein